MPTTSPAARDGRSKKRPGIEVQRERVVSAAVRLFAAEGSGPVSIGRICKEADVSRPTFYRCFADKESLIAHLYERAVATHMRLNLSAVTQQDAGGATIRRELDALLDRMFETPEIAAFLFVESADSTSEAHRIVSDAFSDAAEQITEWYERLGATPPSTTTLRATMAASQWIVKDAIERGLSAEVVADAKAAAWELVSGVFGLR